MDCTIYVVKTNRLISCAVTAQLIGTIVSRIYMQKSRFSDDVAQTILLVLSCGGSIIFH